MNDEYERTFSVSAPVDRAWRAFTEPDELEQWMATSFDADDAEHAAVAQSPGGPMHFEVVEITDHSMLRYRQWAASPERGVDVTVVFESLDNGTRITMTQAGFGGETILQSDEVRRGMDETLADLALYLDQGVAVPRHRDLQSDCSLGTDLSETFAGAVVKGVHPGSFGEAVGLQPGDVLVQLGPAPVFGLGDVAFFQRSHAVGDEAEVSWVRRGSVMSGRERLTRRDELMFAHRP